MPADVFSTKYSVLTDWLKDNAKTTKESDKVFNISNMYDINVYLDDGLKSTGITGYAYSDYINMYSVGSFSHEYIHHILFYIGKSGYAREVIPEMHASTSKYAMAMWYYVPHYVTGFEYTIYPLGGTFKKDIDYTPGVISVPLVDFTEKYNNLVKGKEEKPQQIRIDIERIYYKDAFSRIVSLDRSIICKYTMNSMFADGDGTAESPYGIRFSRHFKNIAKVNGKNYILKENLLFDKLEDFFEFAKGGVFDGNNYEIIINEDRVF